MPSSPYPAEARRCGARERRPAMSLPNRAVVLLAVLLAAAGWVLAEGEKPDGPKQAEATASAAASAEAQAGAGAAKSEATAEDVAGWIRDLADDRFKVRDRATKKLIGAGKPAVTPVAKAAGSDSPEIAARSMNVLKALLGSRDAETSQAAKAALEKLAEDTEQQSGKRAREILDEARPPRGLQRVRVIGPGVGGLVNVRAVAARQMMVVNLNVNGDRTVMVRENGKSVRIEQDNNQITVTVTEKVDGKEKTKQYKAASVEELAKKHPEAHKLYEKYAGKVKPNAPAAHKPAARKRIDRREAADKGRLDAKAEEVQGELKRQVESLIAAQTRLHAENAQLRADYKKLSGELAKLRLAHAQNVNRRKILAEQLAVARKEMDRVFKMYRRTEELLVHTRAEVERLEKVVRALSERPAR